MRSLAGREDSAWEDALRRTDSPYATPTEDVPFSPQNSWCGNMPSFPLSARKGTTSLAAISLKSKTELADLSGERLLSVVMRCLSFGTEGTEPAFVRSVPIHDLNTEDFSLAEPIQIEIEHYADEVISKIPELDLWASEPTESEALLSIKKAIRNLWEELRDESENQLGALPRMWKRILGKKIRTRVPV